MITLRFIGSVCVAGLLRQRLWYRSVRAAGLLLVALTSTSIVAQTAEWPIIELKERFHPVVSRLGMVVSEEALASEVGAKILAKGGNAVDAAVATGFALAVTYPWGGNIAGGGFMLIHLAEPNQTTTIDYRETAPAASTRDMYLNDAGEVDRQLAGFSHLSAGVPGTVAGLLLAHERYGKLSRREVIGPAIDLARRGFPVSRMLYSSLSGFGRRMLNNPAAASYYFKPDGSPYLPGEVLKQRDLARTLQRIASNGRDGFYRGRVAELLVDEMHRGGGIISHRDLENYQAVERPPLWSDYRGFRIAMMPPPSSGGILLTQMLNVLEAYDLRSMGHNSADYIHLLVESMRFAFADRSKYLGDPDFETMPLTELMDKDYAARYRATIDMKHARRSTELQPGQYFGEEGDETTHYTVADRNGNVVVNTYTLNAAFGSGIAVTGAGFLLNNEMFDFAVKPGVPNFFGVIGGEVNAIEPGKRPLSSMVPTLVFRDGKPVLATGSPGGTRIITIVLQILLNVLDFDMNIAAATARPRIHHQWLPDEIRLEPGISRDTLDELAARGHVFSDQIGSNGSAQSIQFVNGAMYGASDTRRPGGGVSTVESATR